MLANLFTVHDATVSSVMGSLRGFTYLTVVICAMLVDGLPGRARMLAWLPVIGGLLALNLARDAR